MAITVLDEHAALVVIDLQKGIVAAPTVHPAAEIVARAAELARAFRESRRARCWHRGQRGSGTHRKRDGGNLAFPPDWRELVSGAGPATQRDLLVTKHRPGAFIGTGLDAMLRERGVTQIVLAGISTSNGVEATARSAYDYGYHVAMVVDAMTDPNAEAHQYNVKRHLRIGETDTTEGCAAITVGNDAKKSCLGQLACLTRLSGLSPRQYHAFGISSRL